MICRADTEYRAEGVKHRLVISHLPFTMQKYMENEIYSEWTRLLREHIKPNLILNGHLHRAEIYLPGGEKDHHNQPCPVVIGSLLQSPRKNFVGAGVTFDEEGIQVNRYEWKSR